MYIATFPQSTTISDENELRRLFHSDHIHMEDGRLMVCGRITIGPGAVFSGTSRLHGPVMIEAGSVLSNVELGAGCIVRSHSVISELKAGERNIFGPFCFIRNHCSVGDDVILGAHVEATRSVFASGVKISHRAFIGDAQIGAETIVGAGTVFCNYEARARQSTELGARVIVGSGTMRVAPLKVADDVVIGAG
jgi:bifunctional UDP-N-acetylglucosamine pyrophosphorylase / glucosamine-1-phosphate N-acetyltransferase